MKVSSSRRKSIIALTRNSWLGKNFIFISNRTHTRMSSKYKGSTSLLNPIALYSTMNTFWISSRTTKNDIIITYLTPTAKNIKIINTDSIMSTLSANRKREFYANTGANSNEFTDSSSPKSKATDDQTRLSTKIRTRRTSAYNCMSDTKIVPL